MVSADGLGSLSSDLGYGDGHWLFLTGDGSLPSHGVVFTSTDGLAWTEGRTTPTNTFSDPVRVADHWLATGTPERASTPQLFTSSDGLTWSPAGRLPTPFVRSPAWPSP